MDEKGAESCWDQALDWLFKINASPEDLVLRRQLEAWARADARHAAALAEARSIWDVTGALPVDAESHPPTTGGVSSSGDTCLGARSSSGARVRRIFGPTARRRLVLALAASVAFLALLAPQLYVRFVSDAETGTAEIRALILRDGSQVVLAPQTAITAELNTSGTRVVRLLRGQAYFEVKRDPTRPFVVQAGDLHVRVLGTGFDVRHNDDEVVVAVRHGHVRVSLERERSGRAADRVQSVDIVTGEQARIGLAERRIAKASVSSGSVGLWQRGRIEAQDWTLGELAEALGRYRPGAIFIGDSELTRAPVAGVYQTDNPDAALELAASLHGARVRRITPWVLWVTRDDDDRTGIR